VKTILVTGGAGFIGSHLCQRLLDRNDRVICLDNYYTGSRRNVAALLDRRGFTLIQQDVTAPLDIAVDQIYNLACPASPPHYQRDPIFTLKTSVVGALNVLELARRHGARVLQASTSEVYGDPDVHPQPETYWGHVNPVGPRACYDEGKRAAETLFADHRRHFGTNSALARIFNTYGPRMDRNDGRVVSNFIVQALLGEDLTLYGDGEQTRSFCYVSDLVSGLIALGDSDLAGPINLGNPAEMTVRELAKAIIELTGSRSKLRFLPLPVDDPRQRRPDLAEASSQLHWSAKVALLDGLRATIDYFDIDVRSARPSWGGAVNPPRA
jgi:UDP-glucuronate decarboxylase